jgi:hypothetical protein
MFINFEFKVTNKETITLNFIWDSVCDYENVQML